MSHHNFKLLSPNYREMYNRSGDGPCPPQLNEKVPQKSSINDKDYHYFEQKLQMMSNRGKNNGVKNLVSQSARNSLLENHKVLHQSFDNRADAKSIKSSLQEVSLRLGFDEKDRAASITAGPSNDVIKLQLQANTDVYTSNKLKSYDSKNLFKNSANATIHPKASHKGIYNPLNMNNKVQAKGESTNAHAYKWTIPKYDI